MRGLRFRIKAGILFGITVAAVFAVASLPPMGQEEIYHAFADSRSVLGIANFWNVVSNIPFMIVGVMGAYAVMRTTGLCMLNALRDAYLTFFLGIFFIGMGSIFYHLDPTNATLVLDRLAMVIALMALFCIVIAENVSENAGIRLFLPLQLFGLFSVGYWALSQWLGTGDLRPYVIVQFLPMLLIPLILLLFPPRFSRRGLLWAMLATYLFSKVAEMGDLLIHAVSGSVGGHSFKHLFAALGAWLFLLMLQTRVRYNEANGREDEV